jgi:hypothetical protein
MKIEFITIKKKYQKHITVSPNGRLQIPIGLWKELNERPFIKFAQDEDGNFYMQLLDNEDQQTSKLSNSGEYYKITTIGDVMPKGKYEPLAGIYRIPPNDEPVTLYWLKPIGANQ